jgi:hypothetical protein
MSFNERLNNCFDYVEQNWKKSLMLIAVVFFIVWKSETLSYLVEKFLMSETDLSNWFLDVVVILVVLCGFILQYRLWRRGYKPSFYQLSVYLISIFAFSYLKVTHNNEWHFYEFTFIEFSYLEAFLYSSLGFPGYCAYRSIAKFFEENKANDSFPLIEDNPTLINETNNFKRQKLVERLIDVISKGQTEKAFSIGIIGPWGNGKSTILDTVYNHFASNDDIIKIKFHPFLNHNDQGVIDEFFKSFQQELRKYSGRLSNHVMDYAEELIRFYKRGDIKKVFESQQNVSAYSLYEKIEKELSDLDKKVVVFVDDLDRLNGVEILQVLKLIRNTANFPNTIFLVAVDKDYVINSLAKEKDYQSQRFVDKFFQLEIYLPPIQEDWLIDGFVQLINEYPSIPTDSKSEIATALKHKYCLFPQYIKNMRDAKRLANQLIFENNFIDKGLDYTDYLNFLMFKMRFPRALQLISNHGEKLFEPNDEYYYLKKDLSVETSINDLKPNGIKLYGYLINRKENKWLSTELMLNELENELFIKSLIYLWGDYDRIELNSICYFRNFNKVMRLSFADSDLLPQDRDLIFGPENFQAIKPFIDGLFKKEKTVQLIHLISIRKPVDSDQFVKVLQILAHFISQIDERELSLQMIFYAIDNWIDPNYFHVLKLDADSIKTILSEHLFDSENVSVERRFELLSLLKNNRTQLSYWGYNENSIVTMLIAIFETQFNKSGFTDEVYRMFRDIDNLTVPNLMVEKELIERLKDSLTDTNILKFCRYLIQQDNLPLKYRISDFCMRLWNIDHDFLKFLFEHRSYDILGLSEVYTFLELQSIIGFEQSIVFKFNEFKPFENIYDFDMAKFTDNRAPQFFIEFEKEALCINLKNYYMEEKTDFIYLEVFSKIYNYDGKTYLFYSGTNIQLKFEDFRDWMINALDIILQRPNKINQLLDTNFDEPKIEFIKTSSVGAMLLLNNITVVSVKSIQPMLN